ncbi:hypothetical protein BDN72DRAFT_246738 [Pluteus cervinus]|uniref:Uncharacterized protein n=1 Tax=Pluteus cervinus TaxID=181527 RepID=A0ACD3B557_9AGAR|nr:hypothetical protein BDN72DRAFT_246738 [Pluteus cervinus]
MATSPPSIPPQADYSDDNVRPSIPPSPDPYPNQIELAVARGIKHPPTVHADFVVKGGKPLVHPNRDPRHPQLYLVSNHHHVDPEHPFLRYILVFIQDTRKKARTAQFKFEESLQVPLGPLKVQYKSGLYILPHGTIIFVRKMGEVDPSKDRAVCWSFTGDKVYGKNLKQGLAQCHEDLIGDASECTLDPPERKNGVYTGGTRFERFGQEGVDKPRVYKFSISNQRQRKMVGPTAGGKVINLDGGAWTPNVEARSRTLKTGTGIAMFSHDQCAPDYLKDTLKKNAELNNVPSIGVADNHCFPGMQVNFAPAIPFEDCKTQGLQGMGDFGSVDGHRDRGDSPAGMTTMVSCSRLPEDYEPGTFFLLYLGVGFVLITSLVCTFLGLYKHGGGPVIAPEGAVKVEPSAYRVILVLYPPASAISAAGVNHIPLSSLPNGDLFKLGAEMTSPFYLDKLKEIVVSNEANYGSDGAPLMTPESHMKFMIGSYLQTCQALSLPLPPAYNVKIDPEIFYSAFKFTNEAGDECQGAAPPQHDPQQQRDEMDAMMESVAEFVPYMRNRDVRQWNRDIADEIDKAPVLRKSKSSAHKGNKAAAVKRKNDLEAGAPNVVKKSGTKRKPITDDSDCGTAHKRSKVGAIESETSSDESEDDWPSTRVQPHRRVFVEVPSLSPSIAAKHKALSNPSKLGYASFPLVTQDFFRMDMSEASNMDVDSGNSSTPLDNPDVIGDPGSSDDDGTRRSSRLQDSDMSVAEDVSLAGHENHGMKEPSHSQPCKDDFIPTEEINMGM